MIGKPRREDVHFFTTPEELRDWFDAHHATERELWVGNPKRSTGLPGLTWSQTVDEALCVGWIDGVRYSLDATTHAQRFTPRRKGSTWSAINVAKVAKLTAEGRMRPAGLAAYEARDPQRTAIYSYEQSAASSFSPDETARFRTNEAAWRYWDAQPPGYRRLATFWVTSAKRAETRARRFEALVAASAEGLRAEPFRPRRDG